VRGVIPPGTFSQECSMGQPVVHWELWSEDPARISDFYQTVFGWTIRAIPELNYRVVETGGAESMEES
jgi:predicted enzyme related to lactoylglutathione lyase